MEDNIEELTKFEKEPLYNNITVSKWNTDLISVA